VSEDEQRYLVSTPPMDLQVATSELVGRGLALVDEATQPRVLRFPDAEVGIVSWATNDDLKQIFRVKAMGTVIVPPEARVGLSCGGGPLDFLRHLPPVALDALQAWDIDDADCRYISELTKLRQLWIVNSTRQQLKEAQVTNDELRSIADMTGITNRSELHPLWLTDAQASNHKHIEELQRVAGMKAEVTNDGLRSLASLTNLEELHLEVADTDVTDEGLEFLASLHNLRKLELHWWGTRVTDGALVSLTSLTSLRELDLSGNEITSDGLRYLGGLAQLEVLDLSYTQVASDGLRHLARLRNLRWLDVFRTKVKFLGQLSDIRDLHVRL